MSAAPGFEILHTNKATIRFGGLIAVNELDLSVKQGEIYVGSTVLHGVIEPGREADLCVVDAPIGSVGKTARDALRAGDLCGISMVLIDGQPARTVHAGESVVIPAGTVHDAHNATDAPARLVAVYVVEKGQPLATPVQ